ncbi:MAG: Fe2+-dependent dioxygenase [Betaproteobacteria bacterium]|nr:Fe2+-dependent dioxygenase [Betaproteobacteria bacterium]
MMLPVENVLTADELANIRKLVDGAEWEAGRETAGAQAALLKNNEQLRHESEAMRAIRQIVLGALDRHPVFFSATLPKRVFSPRVNRYQGDSNHFGAHVDNAIRFAPHTGLRVRTDISCTLFLADPASYDGGELIMHEPGGARAVKLKAGDAIIYPGTTVHEVAPVTRGSRLACFMWIESMVRDSGQRRMLYELDRTIVALRNEHGDNSHSVALTGTYHNLLRMWADT